MKEKGTHNRNGARQGSNDQKSYSFRPLHHACLAFQPQPLCPGPCVAHHEGSRDGENDRDHGPRAGLQGPTALRRTSRRRGPRQSSRPVRRKRTYRCTDPRCCRKRRQNHFSCLSASRSFRPAYHRSLPERPAHAAQKKRPWQYITPAATLRRSPAMDRMLGWIPARANKSATGPTILKYRSRFPWLMNSNSAIGQISQPGVNGGASGCSHLTKGPLLCQKSLSESGLGSRTVRCGQPSESEGIGDEFAGSNGIAHFACEQFEKGQAPARVIVRFVSALRCFSLRARTFRRRRSLDP